MGSIRDSDGRQDRVLGERGTPYETSYTFKTSPKRQKCQDNYMQIAEELHLVYIAICAAVFHGNRLRIAI